jgi:CDP-6-deoxy-D-xylo-4-hexulose-3-dehydrase
MNNIPLQRDTINNSDIDRLIEWLKTYPRLTKGQVTLEFEKKWSEWLGTKFSVFVNSGSSANLLMLYALMLSGRMKNNKVVLPGLCWATDLAPILQLNLEPLLCDISLDTLSIDLGELEQIFITENPSTLLLVSILGFSPRMNEIVELCNKYDVILLEDNCESLGTEYDNKKLGNFGLMTSFSTYFGHHISTIEGGVVSTNDEEMNNILLSIRSHGWDRDLPLNKQKELRQKNNITNFDAFYTFYYPGFNLRSTDLQAYIGIGQIEKLDDIIKKRFENYNRFYSEIKNDFWKPKMFGTLTSNFCVPIIHPNKDKIIEKLIENGIECRPLVCGSMGRQPFYVERYGVKELKNCDLVDQIGIYVPNNHSLTNDELDLIINTINEQL